MAEVISFIICAGLLWWANRVSTSKSNNWGKYDFDKADSDRRNGMPDNIRKRLINNGYYNEGHFNYWKKQK